MAGLKKYVEQDAGIISGTSEMTGGGDTEDAMKPKGNKSLSEAYAFANANKPKTKKAPKKPSIKNPPMKRMPAINVAGTNDPVTKMPKVNDAVTNMPDGSKNKTKAKSRNLEDNKYGAAIKKVITAGKNFLGGKAVKTDAPKTSPLKPGQSFSPYKSEGNGSSNFTKGELVGAKGDKKLYSYSDETKKNVADAKAQTARNFKNDNGVYGSSSYTPGTVKSKNPGYSSDSTTSGGKNDIPVGRYGDETGKQIPIPHSKAGTKEGDAMIASIKEENKKNAEQAKQNYQARIMQDHYNKTGGRAGKGLYKRGSTQMDDPRTAAYRRQGAGKGINDYGSKQAPQARKPDPLANRRYGKKNINNEDFMKGGQAYRQAQSTAKNKALKLPEAQFNNYKDAIKGGATPNTAYNNAIKGVKAKPVVDKKKAAADRMLERDNKRYNG